MLRLRMTVQTKLDVDNLSGTESGKGPGYRVLGKVQLGCGLSKLVSLPKLVPNQGDKNYYLLSKLAPLKLVFFEISLLTFSSIEIGPFEACYFFKLVLWK